MVLTHTWLEYREITALYRRASPQSPWKIVINRHARSRKRSHGGTRRRSIRNNRIRDRHCHMLPTDGFPSCRSQRRCRWPLLGPSWGVVARTCPSTNTQRRGDYDPRSQVRRAWANSRASRKTPVTSDICGLHHCTCGHPLRHRPRRGWGDILPPSFEKVTDSRSW